MKLAPFAPLFATPFVLAGLFASPVLERLDGVSIDSLFLLRHAVFGQLHEPTESPTVVIAIDEDRESREEFGGLPIAMWTPQFGRVIDAVKVAGAKLIGLDLILPVSVEPYVPGYDRPFLLSLKRAADDGRIVLAKLQHGSIPIAPFAGQSDAVGHSRNIRAVNLQADPDGVIRRVPLFFEVAAEGGAEQFETSFALEIAARAGEFTPVSDAEGLTFGPTRVPGSAQGSILLNFDGGSGAIPTYSFADLSSCATIGNMTYFKRAFAGKIVLIGGALEVEDRKLTSKRFIAGRERENAPARCALKEPAVSEGSPFLRQTLPSVYVQATAINDLLRGDSLSVPSRAAIGLILLAICGLAVTASQSRDIGRSALWLGVGAVLWLVVCVGVFRVGLVLPLIDAPIAGFVAFAVPAAFRLAVTDRERNRLRRAFSYYLAPAVIERLLAGNRMPTLSGETRTVSVLYSDIEGFSRISEGMRPDAQVRTMNLYLGAMTELIEAHGGFVDKYIGDAIVAVFGAPLDDNDHALNAVRAALACDARLDSLETELELPADRRLKARIGVNTGSALVGNIGSPRRFNYTVMGDAFNLAIRLEGANKVYGTAILVAYDTVASCGDRIAFREVDRVMVAGRAQAASLYEPMAGEGTLSGEHAAFVTAYGLALADYRAGRFSEAAERFAALGPADRASAAMAVRCRALIAAPPPTPWQGVITLGGR